MFTNKNGVKCFLQKEISQELGILGSIPQSLREENKITGKIKWYYLEKWVKTWGIKENEMRRIQD